MHDKKERKIFRLLPCYKNDVLAMESWLEDMAAEGYMLKKFFLNIAVFVETEPMHIRYRMLPKPANKLMDMGGEPTVQEQFIALRELEGWRHVANTPYYFVFYTKNAALPEPERDLYEIASERHHESKKLLVMEVATTLCAIATLGMSALSLGNIVRFGTLTFLMIFWLFFYAIGVSLCEVLRWNKIKHALTLGESNRNDWQENAGFYKTVTLTVYLVTTVLLIGAAGTYLYNVHPSNTIPMQQYEEVLTIPTMAEWDSNATFAFNDAKSSIVEYNVVEKRSDILAPVMIEFNQNGVLYRGEILLFDGNLMVNYYETIVPALAKPLAISVYENDKAFGEEYNKYQPLETPEIAVDYIIAYNSWYPSFVIAEGNKVVHVQIYQDDGTEEINIDKLAQIYADYLLSEDSATK